MTSEVSKIFGLNKETEFLQSFVRIEISDDEKSGEIKQPPKIPYIPKQPSVEGQDHSGKDGDVIIKQNGIPIKKSKAGKAIFKQLKQEMKNKVVIKKKRNRKEEELYTDKDRAAAVASGSRDIKTSLNAKMRKEKTKALALPEEADSGTLLALGRNEIRCGNFETAINFVNKALELNPDEKNALVARSKCYLLLGEPKLALEDAETALKMDKTFIKAIYQKAEALYFLGDFELSLMFYHRGMRIRPELEGFRLGIQKAQEAIENTIGAHKPLLNPNSLISTPITTPISTGATPSKTQISTPTKPINSKISKDAEKRISRQLLGQLCVDKEYLENLLKNPNLNVADRKSNNISIHAEEAVQFLNKRQEFWRQQRPTTTVSTKRKPSKCVNLGPFPKWHGQI